MKAVFGIERDELELRTVANGRIKVADLAVDLRGDGRFRKVSADLLCDLLCRGTGLKFDRGAVKKDCFCHFPVLLFVL